MPTDGREHIDEVLADRNRGDRRVPTPVVEGTGKRNGGDLSHRGQDERDLTIGEETNFQTAAVSPELEEYANAKGRQQTLDRNIADLEKATGALKDELEAQIAGEYKPQNIHHGQKKEIRQSDLLESEAEKVKANRTEFNDAREYYDEYSGTDNIMPTDEERGDIDLEDDPRVARFPKGDTYGGAGKRSSSSSEDGEKRTPRVQRHTYPDRKPYDWELKSLDSILKRLDVLKDRQSSFDEEENTDPLHAAAVKRKKKLIDQAKRDNVGLGWTKGIVDDKKKDVNTSRDGNAERENAEELRAKQEERRKKKIESSRKRSGEKQRKRIAEGLPDIPDDDERLKSTNVGDDNRKHFSPRRGTLPKGKESVSGNPNLKRLRESKKKPVKDYSGRTDLTEEEAKKLPKNKSDDKEWWEGGSCPHCGKKFDKYPALSREDNKTNICSECGEEEEFADYRGDRKYKAHKSKYTSWNRMDAGVRNEHRNTLGLSSIEDYDQLPIGDQRKVIGAGFWKENLKEQPVKEGTHFGSVGSTPELQAEKKKPKPKPKPAAVGSLRRRRRLGKSLGELKILTQVIKLQSGDDDLERVQHKPSTTPHIQERGTAATSSLREQRPPTKSPWSATPQKPQQSGGGGALPKTIGQGATAAQAPPKQGTGLGNAGVISQGHDKKDYEINTMTHKRTPTKEEKRSNQKIRGGVGRFKDRMRDRAGKKLGSAKEKLEGFVGGYKKRTKPTSGGADSKINRVTPHKQSTRGSNIGNKSPAEPKEPFNPKAGRAATNKKPDNDPTREWNKEDRQTETDPTPETSQDAKHRESADTADFQREEGEKPEDKTDTKSKPKPKPNTGKVGSTRRGRGSKGGTYDPNKYIKMRRAHGTRFKEPTKKRSTRSNRGGGRARYQSGGSEES